MHRNSESADLLSFVVLEHSLQTQFIDKLENLDPLRNRTCSGVGDSLNARSAAPARECPE